MAKLQRVDEMERRVFLLAGPALALAACTGTPPTLGADGRPLPRVYQINPGDEKVIAFRMLDAVNTLRAARSAPPLAFDAKLNAAAATHARDMSVQNRPWHFGSDGSSPLVRVQRAGFTGLLKGELISETYETELETLSSWMGQPDTRDVLLDPAARFMGFAWFQEPGGKIWWTLVTGA
jgi:uncharacterized protein YkwD